MTLRPKFAILTLVSMLLLGFNVSAGFAQTNLKLGWASSDRDNDPYGNGAKYFKEEVERRSEGKITVSLFPNRQLGDEKQLLEGMTFGTIDMALVTNAVISNLEPTFTINDLPFIYADESAAHSALDGDIGSELNANLLAHGVLGLGFGEGGFRHMINNKQPVNNPGDVIGVKYRVMQSPLFIGMFKELGGNAIPLAWSETFTAMQQGTIDGLEIPASVILSTKFYEVAKYLSLTRHSYSAFGVLLSEKTNARLTPEEQKLVRVSAKAAVGRQRVFMSGRFDNVIKQLKANGMEVNEIEQSVEFRDAVRPVYDLFEPKIGSDFLKRSLNTLK